VTESTESKYQLITELMDQFIDMLIILAPSEGETPERVKLS